MTSAFTFSSLLQFLFNDKEYQRKIIDNLVVKVLVDDGDTVVYINLSNTKEIENVRLEEMKTALEHIFGVQTLSPLAQRRGFEPPDDSPPSHDFQSCSLNHSDISASRFIVPVFLKIVNEFFLIFSEIFSISPFSRNLQLNPIGNVAV